MRTLNELLDLAYATARIVGQRFVIMGFWFCCGFAAHTAGSVASSMLGSTHPILATLAFVIAVIFVVVSLVMMIDSCGSLLRVRQDGLVDDDVDLPGSVRAAQPALVVVAATIGPFLGVYAVWGLVEEQVRGIYFVNIALLGTGGGDDWSVDLRRVKFYLILAAVSWVLRRTVGAIVPRLTGAKGLAVALLGVILEGLWVFASFLALTGAGFRVLAWLRGREVWEVTGTAWRQFLAFLPDLSLPFDLTLPRVVAAAGSWLWHDLLPGVGTAILLPLVWLALTATVFGWQQRNTRQWVAGSAVEARAGRIGARLTSRGANRSWSAGRRLVRILSTDLHEKFVPVIDAFVLVLRAGPRFLGAYLVLATLLATLREFVEALLVVLVGPQTIPVVLSVSPVIDVVTGLIFTTLSVALYVAAVDRVFDVVGGASAGEFDQMTLSGKA